VHKCRSSVSDEWFFSAESGQQGRIDIHGFARLTPALHSESANKARTPALRLTQRLQVSGCFDDFNHVTPS
jgi:hypothetical protein